LAVFDAEFYRQKYFPTWSDDENTNHWMNYGLAEGRQSSVYFSIQSYWDRYGDVRQVFGSKANSINHWFDYGQHEGRTPMPDGSAAFPSVPNAAEATAMVKRVVDAAIALNKGAKAL
jgi:hypothetical protein